MNIQSQHMNTALKNIVVPHLRAHHFKGSFPHFRRRQDTHIDLITFQFNRYGGSFVVECTVCPPEGVTMSWGEQAYSAKESNRTRCERTSLGTFQTATNTDLKVFVAVFIRT